MKLLNKDIARCMNHRCSLRTYCKRYMQLKFDYENNEQGIVPVSRFGNKDETKSCEHYLKLEL